ncbi:MAG: hypothetical protein K2M91_09085 [Lachnospiraceae bacterium]|nr:hypothetical protein [Lachnospiraceae bacterium]
MGAKKKIIIIICLLIIGVTCCRSQKEKKSEQKRQNEALVASYPDQIKAYLEKKYGRKFCVNPEWIGGGGSPIPFAQPDYVTYECIAWEDEEHGYAFRTEVYPVSLDDKRVVEIRDSYCWKFISRKIRDEISEAWKEITEEEFKIIIYPYLWKGTFGKRIYSNSGIKEALKEIETEIRIYVIFSPELELGETELNIATEEIATNFYNEYIKESGCQLCIYIWETYTKEDFLKIEPEKSEQYKLKVMESEYEDKNWLPVDVIRRTEVKMKE